MGGDGDRGPFKPLVELDGKPLILHALENAGAVCARCIVVTGHRKGALESYLAGLRLPGVEWVFSQDYRAGMFFSIRAGAARVQSPWFFVAPCDMPCLSPHIYRSILGELPGEPGSRPTDSHPAGRHPAGLVEEPVAAIFPEFQGRRGHPVLVNRSVVPAMYHVDPDTVGEDFSMRSFLAGLADPGGHPGPAGAGQITRTVAVTTDSILKDLDTPREIAAVSGRCRQRKIPVGKGTYSTTSKRK